MAVIPSRAIGASLIALAFLLPATTAADDQPLFTSKRLPVAGAFTRNIEGPAVDAQGNLYVVNLGEHNGGIGRLAPGATKFELFTTLSAGSTGNGIRFDRDGRMFIADFTGKNVLVIERGETVAKTYFHSNDFHQPNDIAVAADGTIYASDPDFPHGTTGRIWRIARNPDGTIHGEIMEKDMPEEMGTTNGIDVSPDGSTLYVSESSTLLVLSYRIDGNHLRDRHVVTQFHDGKEVDGLRTDVDGRIFLARPSTRHVVVLKPDGTIVHTVTTQGLNPNNLTFGGPDGRTVFVTQMDGQFVESFRTDRPGREPCLQTRAQGMC
jgi:sugar lactone lactonase YvrE